jgi:glutathione S-transferase
MDKGRRALLVRRARELPRCVRAYAAAWGGFAGIDPDSLPAYKAYIERVVQATPVAAALERERIRLDTYKKAA